MSRANYETKLLSNETVQEVINLLKKGISQRKTAALIGVSLDTVNRIATGKRLPKTPDGHRTEAVRCSFCGYLIVIQPCPACEARRLKVKSVSGENGTESTAPFIPLRLRKAEFARYLEVKRNVERQINEGLRTPISAVGGGLGTTFSSAKKPSAKGAGE